MSVDIKDKEQFRSHLKGILTYVLEEKKRIPIWNYNNFNEFEELKQICERLNIIEPSIIESMKDLEKEINIAKQKKANIAEAEESFLEHIIGVYSYFARINRNTTKLEYKAIINPMELNKLLERMEKLNTQNPDILIMMRLITKDYKENLYYEKGRKEGNEFQERLFLLGIEAKKKKGFFER
jgi:hypothetical protein